MKGYHSSHLLVGFIFVPAAQLNSVANSFMFAKGPMTRYFAGVCESFSISRLIAWGVTDEHHTY